MVLMESFSLIIPNVNQNEFNVTLSAVTVTRAEEFGLGGFINSRNIPTSNRATEGMVMGRVYTGNVVLLRMPQ